jgi:hypothetical protein
MVGPQLAHISTSGRKAMNAEPGAPLAAHGGQPGDLSAYWDSFCEALRAAGQETLAAAPGELDAAEGLAQFGLLLEAALRWHLRGADPAHPRFVEINDTPEVADNLFAAVDGETVYRVTGDVSTLFDFNLSIHSSWAWLKPSLPSGDMGLSDVVVGDDGRVEIFLGGAPRPGCNWLALPADAQFIQLREYHADYGSHRPGLWDIERLGDAPAGPSRLTPADVVGRLDQTLEWARRYGAFHRASLRSGRTFPGAPNTLPAPAPHRGGNSHIWYGFGRFALKDDEALILEFAKPDARLWSVQWLTDPWYENPDLLQRLTGVVGAEAHVDADGRVRIVFAAEDPGVPNWLDVSGYPSGLFVTRWIWCAAGPETRLSVVPLVELRDRLPPDTPTVTAEQRAAQIARRRKHFVHRRR